MSCRVAKSAVVVLAEEEAVVEEEKNVAVVTMDEEIVVVLEKRIAAVTPDAGEAGVVAAPFHFYSAGCCLDTSCLDCFSWASSGHLVFAVVVSAAYSAAAAASLKGPRRCHSTHHETAAVVEEEGGHLSQRMSPIVLQLTVVSRCCLCGEVDPICVAYLSEER